ncbi:hypothetical protein ACFV85_22200 [Streptomyces niveus]|uniref:hypothetical protein n=1 Tax=Streptomyces niveus TaxID=193462 RepID=UPI00365998A9
MRVLECLPALVRDDSRISVVFAHDPTSAFSDGVLDLLRDAGCRIMPWDQLAEAAPDLILSASENIDIPDGDCPVLVLPHGVGFQKMVPDSRTSGTRLSGVVPDRLLESGRAWLALSHPDQEQQLLAAHPKTAGRTLLVGDPCFDELRASRARRASYRTVLGVDDDRRLVVVSSTWGATSLVGREPDIPARLLASLPYDEYRVALILHPNVWAAHGAWQVRVLLASAMEAGLILVPPVHSWRPALVAADLVIGDHGSVTLYGGALGIPLLLGAFGRDAVPRTAASALSEIAPRLDPRADLHRQVVTVIDGREQKPGAALAQHAFADPGHAHARLREALYRLIRLPEPHWSSPGPPTLDPPDTSFDKTASLPALRVTSTLTAGEPAQGPTVTVRRVPAAVAGPGPESPGTYAHLAVGESEKDRCLAESASVILAERPAPSAVGALTWIADTLSRYPGCLLTATVTGLRTVLVGSRDGRVVTATVTGPAPEPGQVAAVVYTLLRADRPFPDGPVTLCLGERTEDVVLRLRPAKTFP